MSMSYCLLGTGSVIIMRSESEKYQSSAPKFDFGRAASCSGTARRHLVELVAAATTVSVTQQTNEKVSTSQKLTTQARGGQHLLQGGIVQGVGPSGVAAQCLSLHHLVVYRPAHMDTRARKA